MLKSTPTKHNDPEVKKQSIAVKYRAEQEYTALEAIKASPNRLCAVELYAGTGGLTAIYEYAGFNVITNDKNMFVMTRYHFDAKKFINIVLSTVDKIDLIDFDCYGCPALEIQEYFKVRGSKDTPFVLRFSDGLGLWMKRSKNEEVIRKRYLIEGPIVMERVWDRHADMIDYFMKKIAGQYGMTAEKIRSVITKHKNYCLGAYKFTKI